MKIPLSLIKTFLEIDVEIAVLAETLTLLGIEVDAILNAAPRFSGVVAAKILSVKKHPETDSLSILEIKDEAGTYSVVSSAPNCREGMVSAFGKPGAMIEEDAGKRRIESCTIRGVTSEGVLFSEKELHLSDDHLGIMELSPDTALGTDLSILLWDPVFELSLTPNLGHCLSALGIARELIAALNLPLITRPAPLAQAKGAIEEKIQVHVASFQDCPRYLCCVIEGVEVAPSPFWLQKLLKSAGIKPINNVVDATNYICLKLGQPLHAFDLDLLKGNKLEVKQASAPFPFLGLDGVERKVPANTLVITDKEKPVALAGILGAENSAVSLNTKNLLLEAAFFDPKKIRIASKKLSLRTESAIRFEKGVDPNGIQAALEEAADLILKIAGGKLVSGQIDLKKQDFPPKTIGLRKERVSKILGTKLSMTEIKDLLERLNLKTHLLAQDQLQVDVPYYRFDITEEIDLIEEVARIYGYNNLEKGPALFSASSIPHNPLFIFERQLREKLSGFGLQEFLTSDLISPKLAACAEEIVSSEISLLSTLHAKTEEYSLLRPSLLPGLLQVSKGNFDQKSGSFSAFEIGKVHFKQKDTIFEVPTLALVFTGELDPFHWSEKEKEATFYDLKGLIENLFTSLRIAQPKFTSSKHISFHPSRQTNIEIEGILVGSFGEIHPALLHKFGIKQKILFAEIDIEHLLKKQQPLVRMKPLPQFPASERDWTVKLEKQKPIEELISAIKKAASPLLEKVELIDLFHPEEATKNATFRFTYRDLSKTVLFEEVESEHARILSAVNRF